MMRLVDYALGNTNFNRQIDEIENAIIAERPKLRNSTDIGFQIQVNGQVVASVLERKSSNEEYVAEMTIPIHEGELSLTLMHILEDLRVDYLNRNGQAASQIVCIF